jgi:hypothetical protein
MHVTTLQLQGCHSSSGIRLTEEVFYEGPDFTSPYRGLNGEYLRLEAEWADVV